MVFYIYLLEGQNFVIDNWWYNTLDVSMVWLGLETQGVTYLP